MCRFYCIILAILSIIPAGMMAQPEYFNVEPVSFSSGIDDEYSPVFYRDGLVYCSNRRDNSLAGFQGEQHRLFNILYVSGGEGRGWKNSRLLAKELSTGYNDGPVTFSVDGNTIYYSRNNSVKNFLRNMDDPSNKLGIYSADYVNGKWTDIKAFPFNDPLYNYTTPALTPGGDRIYFASDKPGGIGGMDLYYCEWNRNQWDPPVNLGTKINTPGNESFPFAGKYGKLYFSSDGHEGLGGMDIFFTREINGSWIPPVHLDSAINSPADDFGILTDSTFDSGYFTSNRRKTDDIYSFHRAPVEFADCDTLREDNFCYTLYDERYKQIDTIPVIYSWDFGNGILRSGVEVKHCFPGPGSYVVKLSIFDELSGDTIADRVVYKIRLENTMQAYINSLDVGIAGEPFYFTGSASRLGNFAVTDYYWDFGEGFVPGGPQMKKTFGKESEYTVRMGLLSSKDSTRGMQKTCVMKTIRVFRDYEEIPGLPGRDREKAGRSFRTVQTRLLFLSGLPEREKYRIAEELNMKGQPLLRFNRYGLDSLSYPFMETLAGILKENQDIRLEMILQDSREGGSGESADTLAQWAGELAFYLKNRDVSADSFHSMSGRMAQSPFQQAVKENDGAYGVLQLLFMRKY